MFFFNIFLHQSYHHFMFDQQENGTESQNSTIMTGVDNINNLRRIVLWDGKIVCRALFVHLFVLVVLLSKFVKL
jgi:hypothetical protein